MSYSQFDLETAIADFDLTLREQVGRFSQVAEVKPLSGAEKYSVQKENT